MVFEDLSASVLLCVGSSALPSLTLFFAYSRYGEPAAGRLAPDETLPRYQFERPVAPHDASGRLLPLIYGGPVGEVGAGDAKTQAYVPVAA